MQEQSGFASYHQLEEFLDQSQQKAFWIFSFGQVVGLFAGLFVGRLVGGMLPHALGGILGTPLLFAGALLGVVATWKVRGQPVYARVWNSVSFLARRLARLGTARVSSGDIYDIPVETVAPVEWAAAGRPAFIFAGEERPLDAAGRLVVRPKPLSGAGTR